MTSSLIWTLFAFVCLQHVNASPLDNPLEKRTTSTMQCNEDNLLRALQHRTPDSYSFCRSYISQPDVTYVTSYFVTTAYTYTSTSYYYRHPMDLYNLQRWDPTLTPITYKSPPTPSPVPGGVCDYPHGGYCGSRPKNKRHEILPRATTTSAATTTTAAPAPTTTTTSTSSNSLPSYLATYPPSRISSGCTCLSPPYSYTATIQTDATLYTSTTSTSCTYYGDSYAPTIFPAYCAATVQVNAPAINTAVASIATVKSFSAPNKLSCCEACGNAFNCVWWNFKFAKTAKDGTGDPWAAGSCQYGYFYGFRNSTLDSNTPAVCPNGIVGEIIDSKYDAALRFEEANLNKSGYNHGPCGNSLGEFQSSQDFGYPDNYYYSQCQN